MRTNERYVFPFEGGGETLGSIGIEDLRAMANDPGFTWKDRLVKTPSGTGNLAVVRDGEYVGYLDFFEGAIRWNSDE